MFGLSLSGAMQNYHQLFFFFKKTELYSQDLHENSADITGRLGSNHCNFSQKQGGAWGLKNNERKVQE